MLPPWGGGSRSCFVGRSLILGVTLPFWGCTANLVVALLFGSRAVNLGVALLFWESLCCFRSGAAYLGVSLYPFFSQRNLNHVNV